MIKASELRKGKLISFEDELYTVHESRHVAKGNKGSYMQTKLRGVKSGNMIDMRFNVNDRIETRALKQPSPPILERAQVAARLRLLLKVVPVAPRAIVQRLGIGQLDLLDLTMVRAVLAGE